MVPHVSGPAIEVLTGSSGGHAFPLDPGRENLVGTSRAASVRLLDKGVFFKHARLEPTAAGWVLLEGLASARVTVNGEPLAPGKGRLLRDGDLVTFGDVQARFLAGPPAPSAADLRPGDDPAGEVIRLRERNRLLDDEVGALVARLHAGEAGRLRAELEQARDERDAAQRRAASLEDAMADLVRRHNDEAQAYDLVYRAKLANYREAGPEVRLLLEGDALRAGLAQTKRELEADVAALRRAAAEAEAAHLAQVGALRERVAALEAAEGEARGQLGRLNGELRDAALDLQDAREALARLAGGG
ncbi:MAG: FHA domain-containing protein [Planctomycetes bacterium]|nr:FHA domain-containing protein [Planctomycetota bacterium]